MNKKIVIRFQKWRKAEKIIVRDWPVKRNSRKIKSLGAAMMTQLVTKQPETKKPLKSMT